MPEKLYKVEVSMDDLSHIRISLMQRARKLRAFDPETAGIVEELYRKLDYYDIIVANSTIAA